MEDTKMRQIVADTGRILLEKGLVARTWGNISCRVDETHFAISPSGLGYETMQAEDVPVYDFTKDEYSGSRKPSSEKKIHAAAYKLYPEVNFVIHTHQDYATAIGLVGTADLEMTEEERKLLGNIEIAGYGLPGTKKLKRNVENALMKKSKVVLMVHHGAVILGSDLEDAIRKSEVLEDVCKRTIENKFEQLDESFDHATFPREVLETFEDAILASDDNILFCAKEGKIPSQLDDLAQMIGTRITSCDNNTESIVAALEKYNAVLIEDVGCLINADDPDDIKALEILVKKAALTYRYCEACGVKKKLGAFDCMLMKAVFKMKYSKQKKD